MHNEVEAERIEMTIHGERRECCTVHIKKDQIATMGLVGRRRRLHTWRLAGPHILESLLLLSTIDEDDGLGMVHVYLISLTHKYFAPRLCYIWFLTVLLGSSEEQESKRLHALAGKREFHETIPE